MLRVTSGGSVNGNRRGAWGWIIFRRVVNVVDVGAHGTQEMMIRLLPQRFLFVMERERRVVLGSTGCMHRYRGRPALPPLIL